DPDGHIVSYLWEFGDNTSAPGAAPSHTYSQPGTYVARLTVTDNSGATATASTVATIATSQPAPSNLEGLTWCEIHLHWIDNSSDETGFIVERSTDNGATYSTIQTLPPNTRQALSLPRPNHTQGSFIYRVRATNAQGVSAPSNTYVAEPLCNGCSCQSGTPSFAPSVTMTAPANGTKVAAGSNVSLIARVTSTNALSSVKFYQGTTFIGDGTLVNPPTTPPSYVFNWQNVPAGNYSLTATATETGGLAGTSTPVTLSVIAPPTVSITNPPNNQRFTPPGNITINATASATNATITKVEFFQGTTKIGEDTSAPYSFNWTGVTSDAYQLTAKATDSNQLSTTSAPVAIIVNSLPVVTLTSPAANQVFEVPGPITLTADASEKNGAITKVDFYRGPTLIGTATTAPYSVTWSNVAAGSYLVNAIATDSFGVTASAGSVNIYVGHPPSVSITSPVNEANLPPSLSTVTATASSPNGGVTKVEFFQGSTKIGEDVTAPYSIQWANTISGRLMLTAKVTDVIGLTATSAPVSVLVGIPPTVSLSTPSDGQVFTPPGSISLSATASDVDGTITQVDFFQGTTLIGTDTSSPYTYAWNGVASGVYSITARATDNAGLMSTSTARTVIVNASPAVSITSPANRAILSPGSNIVIDANASDSDGAISQVEFYHGTSLLGIDTTSPYSITLNNVASSSYVFTAKATDNRGAVTTSAPIAVTTPVFFDDFNDNSLNAAKWSVLTPSSPAVVSEQGQQLRITLPASTATYNGVVSNASYDMRGATVQVEVSQPVSQAGWVENNLKIEKDASNYLLINVGAGSIMFRSTVNGSNDQLIIPYEFPAHRHWRIRHDAGSNAFSFETSSDAVTWTTRKTATAGFSLSATKFQMVAGAWGTGNASPGAAIYNDFQYISDANAILSDDFNDNSIDTAKWTTTVFSGFTDSSLPVNETAQRFEIGPLLQNTSGSHYRGLASVNTYDFTDASAYVELVQAASAATSGDSMFTIGPNVDNYYRMYVSGGQLIGQRKVAGTKTTLFSISYDAVNHRFLRIRHEAGSMIMDTAPANGSVPGTWTQQYTQLWNSAVTLTSTLFEVKGGTSVAETVAPGKVIFDNFMVKRNTQAPPSPTLSSVSPTSGPISGGTVLTLTGSQFVAGATVTVGGVAATSVNVTSSTSITATAPAHTAGVVSVVVTNPDGGNATLNNAYTYTLPSDIILEDNFDDNSINTSKWTTTLFSGFTDSSLPMSETAQRLEIGPLLQNTSGSHYLGVASVSTHNFTNGIAYVELVQAASTTTSADSMFTIGPNVDNYYRIYISGGQLIGQRKVGGTKTTLFSISYDAVNHRFLRIRHSGGSMIMETAPSNGSGPGTWTQQFTQMWNSAVTVTSVYFEVKGGTWQAESNAAGKVIFDNFIAHK
ncbi:MAG TPA: Ig-like domain-containing protein, partial [Pyrinomonadaceae bacterium]